MSLAELLVQKAGQSADYSKQDVAGNIAKGAELAMQAEQLQQNRMKLAQAKDQLEGDKITKAIEAIQKGTNLKGQAATNYNNKVLPAYMASLGVDNIFTPDKIAFVTSDPLNRGRLDALVDMVAKGQMSRGDAVNAFKDEVAFLDIKPTYDEQQDIIKRLDTAAGENMKTQRAQMQAQAAMSKQVQAQQEAGNVEVRKKTAVDFTKFQTGGGMASANNKLDKLRGVLADLKAGKIKTGTKGILAATSTPGVGGDTLLAKINPQVKAAQDAVRSGVNLKGQMDSQFGDKAMGEAFARAFDPNLPTEENVKKVEAMINELETDLGNKVQQFNSQGFEVANKKGNKPTAQAPKQKMEPAQIEQKASELATKILAKFPDNPKAQMDFLTSAIPIFAREMGITEAEARKMFGRNK